jgi:hypothetical protein
VAKAIEKDSGHWVVRGEVGRRPARHPVLLQYVLAREGNKRPVLFSLPLGFDEEALVVFSSGRAAHSFALANALGQEWRTKICSAGELASWLLGPYMGTEWVLLDPLPKYLAAGDTSTNLTRWEDFLDYLLGQAVGKHGRPRAFHDDR